MTTGIQPSGSKHGQAVLVLAVVAAFIVNFGRAAQLPFMQDLETAFGLSGAEWRYVTGAGIVLPCAVFAFLVAWWADRHSPGRTLIVALGAVGIGGLLSGLAQSRTGLFGGRWMVLSAATCVTPLLAAIVAARLPAWVRGRAFSAIYLAPVIAIAVVSPMASLLGLIPQPDAPPWRIFLTASGLLGLLGVALAVAVLRSIGPAPAASGSDRRRFRSFLAVHGRALACIVISNGLLGALIGAVAVWTMIFLQEAHGVTSVQEVATFLFAPTMVTQVCGALATGWIGDRWARRGMKGGKSRLILGAWLVSLPALVIATLVPNLFVAFAALAVYNLFATGGYSVAHAVLQDMAPDGIRARVAATLQLVATWFTGLSVLGVGLLREALGLPLALASWGSGLAVVGVALAWFGTGAYERARQEAIEADANLASTFA